MNEEVRQALEAIWQAERVCLTKKRAYDALNEEVRQALEAIWQAERVCLTKKRAYDALDAAAVQAKHAWELAREECDGAGDRLYALVLQAEKEEAA